MTNQQIEFNFSLKLTLYEKSKDSSTRYEQWEFEEETLLYLKRYATGKFKNKPPIESRKVLTAQEISTLRSLVAQDFFRQTINHSTEPDFKLPYQAIELNWSYSTKNCSSSIQLYNTKQEIEKDLQYQNFTPLLQLLTQLCS